MSGVDVCVVCNCDAETDDPDSLSWSKYIIQQASVSAAVSSRTLLDADLTRPGAADALRTARVVVVVVSSGHLDYLTSCVDEGDPTYGACTPERGLILLCGVNEADLVQPSSSGRKASYHFPRYSDWQRVQYSVEQSVLAEKLNALLSTSTAQPRVELLPTTAHCEDETLMSLSFAEEVPASSKVDVKLSSTAHDEATQAEEIAATRVNPYTYRFIAPCDHSAGDVTVDVRVDKRLFASLSMCYVSVGPLLADVTQVYMHLLNTVCSQLASQTVSGSRPPVNLSATSLDEKLSCLFDDDLTSNVPTRAFEQLFGAHRYDVEMHKDFELPTLIHFAAKFGFKELCAKLIDLPDASYAGKFTNCHGQQPNDIAKLYRHAELSRFLDSFLEMDREFESMYITYYNEKGDTVPGGGRYQNTRPAPVDDSTYMAMNIKHRHPPGPPQSPPGRRETAPIIEDAEAVYMKMSGPSPSAGAVAKRAITPQTTAKRGGSSDPHMSAAQRELVAIMEQVKAKKISQAQAEILFREWKMKNEGQSMSFREKSECLAKMNEAMRQARSETTQAPRENVRLSDTSVGSRGSTASRSSNLSTSGIDTDFDEPPVPARAPPPKTPKRKPNR